MDRLVQGFALALVATTVTAVSALAQPSRPSDAPPAAIERSERPTSKSDAYRVVGKVVEIDREGGMVKLQTEDGVVTAKARPDSHATTLSRPRSIDPPSGGLPCGRLPGGLARPAPAAILHSA